MKPLITIYCEGSETKISVLTSDKEGVKLIRNLSVTSLETSTSTEIDTMANFSMEEMDNDFSFDNLDEGTASPQDQSEIALIANNLLDLKLSQAQFLPVITEPVLNYHVYEGPKENDNGNIRRLEFMMYLAEHGGHQIIGAQ